MNNKRVKVTDRLHLYGIYHIRHVQPGTRPQARTIRALFLGETRKLAGHTLDGLAAGQEGGKSSPTDRYLDVVFIAYRPGNGIPESVPSSRYDVFTIFYCDPSGLTLSSDGSIVDLPAGYRVKQFVDHPDTPHQDLIRKLRGIGENSGLIDTNLEQIGKKASSPLTRTKIRELHRGFTKLVERAEPDVPVSE